MSWRGVTGVARRGVIRAAREVLHYVMSCHVICYTLSTVGRMYIEVISIVSYRIVSYRIVSVSYRIVSR